MWTRDWPGWRLISITAGVISGCAAMITPEYLGITATTAHWVILIMTVVCGVSASLGNSGLPGQKELTAMSVGKAVITPTVENKAAAVAVINEMPVSPVMEVKK